MWGCGEIEAADVRHEDGVGVAVGNVVSAAEWIAEGVDGGGVDGAEAEAAVEAAEGDLFAGGEVVWFTYGGGERGGDFSDSVEGPGVDHGVREVVRVGFDAVGEGVEAGGGGDVCGDGAH